MKECGGLEVMKMMRKIKKERQEHRNYIFSIIIKNSYIVQCSQGISE